MFEYCKFYRPYPCLRRDDKGRIMTWFLGSSAQGEIQPQDDSCGIMTCGYLSVPRFCPKITAFEFACYIYNHKYKNKFLYFGLYRLPIKSVIFYGFLFLLSRHTGEGRYLLRSCFFGFGGMQWAPTFVGVTHPPFRGAENFLP